MRLAVFALHLHKVIAVKLANIADGKTCTTAKLNKD